MRVTALAVAAALTLAVATGCAGNTPQHQDGAAAPAGSPSAASPSASATAEAPTPAASGTPSSTGTATSNTTQANTTPQRCQTGQLAADIEQYTPAGKAGSTQDARVKLTNNGERCTVTGYVKLQLFAGSQPRETRVVESNGPPKTVTLDRGQSAWAQIAWGFLPGPDEEAEPYCSPRATAAAVTPPGQSGSLRVSEDFRAVCNHGEIYVSPLSATRPG